MKTILTILFLAITPLTKVNNVYICDSKNATVYHSTKTCKGLQKCSHQILEVTIESATKTYNRRACKICY